MGVGPSLQAANDMLGQFDLGASLWVQMHVDDPGEDGTSNVATMTDRAEITLPAASGAARSMTDVIAWGSVWSGGEEEITHVSLWTASSGGAFRGSARLSSPALAQDGYVPRIRLAVVNMLGVASG